MYRRRAFTLIELLVVISIIALLLSILMPSLKMVKKQAKSLVCRTNIYQMSLASLMYAEDNDQKFFYYPSAYWTCQLWIQGLEEYASNVNELRYCPEVRVREMLKHEDSYIWGSTTAAWMIQWGDTDYPEQGSYAINGYLYTPEPGLWYEEVAMNKLGQVEDMGRAPIFGDSVWVDCWPKNTDTVYEEGLDMKVGLTDWEDPRCDAMNRFLVNRHSDGINLSFVDGHAEKVDYADLWTLKWHKGAKPNRDVDLSLLINMK